MIAGIELARACAQAADEVKAENIQVLDVRGLSSLTDFIVVCSGNSMPHLKAIMRDVDKIVSEKHASAPNAQDGNAETRWVILDYVDVMVHIMLDEMREHYALEELWGDGVAVDWA